MAPAHVADEDAKERAYIRAEVALGAVIRTSDPAGLIDLVGFSCRALSFLQYCDNQEQFSDCSVPRANRRVEYGLSSFLIEHLFNYAKHRGTEMGERIDLKSLSNESEQDAIT